MVFICWLLCLGQKVANLKDLKLNVTQKDMIITTDKGTEIKADLVISCAGNRINSMAYSTTMSMYVCVFATISLPAFGHSLWGVCTGV